MIKIKDSIIGEGIPKICVPIVEKTQEAILDQAQEIVSESVDIVEWRLDFYDDVHDIDCVIQTADLLQSILGKTVLIQDCFLCLFNNRHTDLWKNIKDFCLLSQNQEKQI